MAQGDWPINLAEVKEFLPGAAKLKADAAFPNGLKVRDKEGNAIGYALRTMPHSKEVIGYSGPTDALLVFGKKSEVLGVAIRHSYDTPSHVEDVKLDLLFMESWNGMSREEIAAIEDPGKAGIYAVSGATRTSEALIESISQRLKAEEGEAPTSKWSVGWKDFALIGFLLVGCLFAFWKNKKFQKWRWLFSLATIGILGFWMGDLIAQSLLVGWMESRIPWEATPGLAIFVIATFLIPWFTRQPVYCQFICPHGNLQRWARKVMPARWKFRIGDEGKFVFRWLPPVLLAVVLLVSFWHLNFDLAGLEPFDAYLLGGAGLATILVAVAGLVISLFIPMAYCSYGCPTGWLLEFVRRRSGKGVFGPRDWLGAGLLILAIVLHRGWWTI